MYAWIKKIKFYDNNRDVFTFQKILFCWKAMTKKDLYLLFST